MKGIKAFFVVSYTSAFLLTGSPMGSQEGEEMERKIENVQLLVSEAHTSDGGRTCLIENHKFKPFRICFIGWKDLQLSLDFWFSFCNEDDTIFQDC